MDAAADKYFSLPHEFGGPVEETYEDLKNDILGFIRK